MVVLFESLLPGPQKCATESPFGMFLEDLGNLFTYFRGPGGCLLCLKHGLYGVCNGSELTT